MYIYIYICICISERDIERERYIACTRLRDRIALHRCRALRLPERLF